MRCPQCRNDVEDGALFCSECGFNMSVNTQFNQPYSDTQSNVNNVYNNQQQFNNRNNGYTANEQSYSMPYNPMSNNAVPGCSVDCEPSVTLGKYLLWFAAGSLFGPISFIVTVVFALMGKNVNRANFFRALLIIRILFVILAAVAVVLFIVFGVSDETFGMIEEYAYMM